MTSTATPIDLAALTRAIEERDAAAQLAWYADDAEIRMFDKNHPPQDPRVISGKQEIASYLDDVAARDMTHRVSGVVADGGHVALTENCRYPDGTEVFCSCLAETAGGLISRQTVVQVWDE